MNIFVYTINQHIENHFILLGFYNTISMFIYNKKKQVYLKVHLNMFFYNKYKHGNRFINMNIFLYNNYKYISYIININIFIIQ